MCLFLKWDDVIEMSVIYVGVHPEQPFQYSFSNGVEVAGERNTWRKEDAWEPHPYYIAMCQLVINKKAPNQLWWRQLTSCSKVRVHHCLLQPIFCLHVVKRMHRIIIMLIFFWCIDCTQETTDWLYMSPTLCHYWQYPMAEEHILHILTSRGQNYRVVSCLSCYIAPLKFLPILISIPFIERCPPLPPPPVWGLEGACAFSFSVKPN